jgi:hypothetical protein
MCSISWGLLLSGGILEHIPDPKALSIETGWAFVEVGVDLIALVKDPNIIFEGEPFMGFQAG